MVRVDVFACRYRRLCGSIVRVTQFALGDLVLGHLMIVIDDFSLAFNGVCSFPSPLPAFMLSGGVGVARSINIVLGIRNTGVVNVYCVLLNANDATCSICL